MQPVAGYNFLGEFAKALGLEGRLISRIVVDASVDAAVKVYIEEYLEKKHATSLVELCAQTGKVIRTEEPKPNRMIVVNPLTREVTFVDEAGYVTQANQAR